MTIDNCIMNVDECVTKLKAIDKYLEEVWEPIPTIPDGGTEAQSKQIKYLQDAMDDIWDAIKNLEKYKQN